MYTANLRKEGGLYSTHWGAWKFRGLGKSGNQPDSYPNSLHQPLQYVMNLAEESTISSPMFIPQSQLVHYNAC